jgi:hypothetical protein
MRSAKESILEAPIPVTTLRYSQVARGALRGEASASAPPLQRFDRQTLLGETRSGSNVTDERRWAPRSALLLGGGVSLVFWGMLIWGLVAIL